MSRRDTTAESFKPIRLKFQASPLGRVLFLGRLILDLQAMTVYAFLRRHLPALCGTVLDVGCGESPFAHLLGSGVRYVGIDIEGATEFGMSGDRSILRYDGKHLPFDDATVDHILCTEVLEHVPAPDALVAEMRRVLMPGGSLIVTVPFSARVHHAPYDFHRFTVWRLRGMFDGFADLVIEERGTDLTSIAAKLVVVAARLASPRPGWDLLWRLPALVAAALVAVIAIGLAHLALALGIGSPSDPLGYALRAVKPNDRS